MDRIIRSLFMIGLWFIGFSKPVQADEKIASLYNQQQWKNALNAYAKIEPKSSAIWYNMGNCAYYLQDYSYALACWIKAISGSNKKEFYDIIHNIHMLQQQLLQEKNMQPTIREFHWYDWVLQSTSWLALQLLFLLFWFSIAAMLLYKKRKKYIGVGSFGLSIIIFIMITKYTVEHRMIAVIKDNKTEVLVGPDRHFQALGYLNQADCVKIIKEKKGWVAIQGHGIEGWIETGTIHRI